MKISNERFKMSNWISPRIWRCPKSRFNEDEPLNACNIYTEEEIEKISTHGFDAIWMRGRLRELSRSVIFPELNDPKSGERIASLREVMGNAKKKDMGLYLFFNEPLALPAEHSFWVDHPEMNGEPYSEFDGKTVEMRKLTSFCTSTPEFKAYFRESVRNLFDDLPGLAGVILITASEFQTHCWSHRAKKTVGDKDIDSWVTPVECPRCRDREPSEVVCELIKIWADESKATPLQPRIWAWNWTWSMWYPEPQREIIDNLPDNVELMADFERGGYRNQAVGEVFIDEYSLGYSGPSNRFIKSKKVADEKQRNVCAKLQIGTTHELATVPNIPLISTFYEKLRSIDELALDGLMCSWNFGNCLTINTYAMKFFADNPELRNNKNGFLINLAKEYFGINDENANKVVNAWDKFSKAFNEYPFSITMVYYSPMNFAPAYKLDLHYENRKLGPAWIPHSPWGDKLESCTPPFTMDQVCQCFGIMEQMWSEGLEYYTTVLEKQADMQTDSETTRRCWEELSCAQMIACHLSSIKTIYDFHNWRLNKIAKLNLKPPCDVPPDEISDRLIQSQARFAAKARELLLKDSRLGYHQEPGEYLFTPDMLNPKT